MKAFLFSVFAFGPRVRLRTPVFLKSCEAGCAVPNPKNKGKWNIPRNIFWRLRIGSANESSASPMSPSYNCTWIRWNNRIRRPLHPWSTHILASEVAIGFNQATGHGTAGCSASGFHCLAFGSRCRPCTKDPKFLLVERVTLLAQQIFISDASRMSWRHCTVVKICEMLAETAQAKGTQRTFEEVATVVLLVWILVDANYSMVTSGGRLQGEHVHCLRQLSDILRPC